jgi:hypothetical protein
MRFIIKRLADVNSNKYDGYSENQPLLPPKGRPISKLTNGLETNKICS